MKASGSSSILTRIVKMTFHVEQIETFRKIFMERKNKIRQSDGCVYLELYQDAERPEIFITYSKWLSEAHLEAYRTSSLFQETWALTKVLFSEKPEAWSLNSLISLA
jgi:quinol monooxygenase YgiN